MDQNNALLEMFGLTAEQSLLMFSTERMIAAYDIYLSKDKKNYQNKLLWLSKWEESILLYLRKATGNKDLELLKRDELFAAYKEEYEKSPNKTWFYISALECLEFTPYTALGDDEQDKIYKKLKYNEKACDKMLNDFFVELGYISKEMIDRLYKTYDRSISKISGKGKSIAVKVLVVLGITALCAALAAVGAGPIAVAIFGDQFAFSGAALTSACLAMAGGGAVGTGLGMAGGVAVIAGGGALLGFAGSGTAVAATSLLLLKAPDFTLTQAAKLETILKEIILNSQHDIVNAQMILNEYKKRIGELSRLVEEIKLDSETTKKELKRIKESLKYMEKSYNNMRVFESAFNEGLKVNLK